MMDANVHGLCAILYCMIRPIAEEIVACHHIRATTAMILSVECSTATCVTVCLNVTLLNAVCSDTLSPFILYTG